MDTPLFDETFRALHPRERRRHRWDGPAQPLPARAGRTRHALDSPTEAIRLGRHADDEAGRADDWHVCQGENRSDPDSWDDPEIADAWADPKDIPCG